MSSELKCPLATDKDSYLYIITKHLKGKLVWISPEKFLNLTFPLTKPKIESLKRLEDRICNQLPIDFLLLKVDIKKQLVVGFEGRHRSIVAQKLGITKVPVFIYTNDNTEWTVENHDIVDKVVFVSPLNINKKY